MMHRLRTLSLIAGAALLVPAASAFAGEEPTDFDQAMDQVYPLSPEQIRQIREAREQTQKAITEKPDVTGSARANAVRFVDLTQGAAPEKLRLVLNYTSTIMFVGENGAPWPIETITTGNDALLSITQPEQRNTSAMLTPKKPWAPTNITAMLEGRVAPVTVFANVHSDPVDGLDAVVTIRVDGIPPGTEPLPIKTAGVVDDALQNAIHFAPGKNWKRLPIKDDKLPLKMNVWTSPNGKRAIVRLAGGGMRFPTWDAQANSVDNTVHVYRFNHVPLMFLVADRDGVGYQVRVEGSTSLLANSDGSSEGESETVLNVEPIFDRVRKQKAAAGQERMTARNAHQPMILSGKAALTRIQAAYEDVPASGSGLIEPLPVEPAEPEPAPGAKASAAPTLAKAPTPVSTPAPAPEPEPEVTFTFEPGTLYKNLLRMKDEFGWRNVAWRPQNDFAVTQEDAVTYTADDELGVLRQVLKTYASVIRGEFWEKNQTVVILPR